MKNKRQLFLAFAAFLFSSAASACLMDNQLKIPFETYSPPQLSDGWTVASPDTEGINGEALQNVYRYVHDSDELWQIRSLLVFRNDKLLAESYMKDSGDRTRRNAIWSCTKQFTAILTGIAQDKGFIDIEKPISEYLPGPVARHTDKGGITIKDLLMMKSGINFNNDGFNGETAKMLRGEVSDSLDFILNLGMKNPPGKSFNYNDGDPHIVSAVLQEKTGKPLREWAAETLCGKIGIANFEWVSYKDGITMGAFGILTTPREMAKLGQLVLNGGKWHGETIVSEQWLDSMTAAQSGPDETGEPNTAFGYFWWRETARGLAMMRGHGGQYVFINKSKNLMVVITSEPNTQGDFQLSLSQGLSIYDRVVNTIVN